MAINILDYVIDYILVNYFITSLLICSLLNIDMKSYKIYCIHTYKRKKKNIRQHSMFQIHDLITI